MSLFRNKNVDAKKLVETGEQLYHKCRYEEALDACDRAIKVNPNLADAYYYRFFTLEKLNRIEDALKSLEEAITINPNQKRWWKEKGDFIQRHLQYQNNSNFNSDEAEESYRKSLELDPKYKPALIALNTFIPENNDLTTKLNEKTTPKEISDGSAEIAAKKMMNYLKKYNHWKNFIHFCLGSPPNSHGINGYFADGMSGEEQSIRYLLAKSVEIDTPRKIYEAQQAGPHEALMAGNRIRQDLSKKFGIDERQQRWIVDFWKILLKDATNLP